MDALMTSDRSTLRSLSQQSQFPEYDGNPATLLTELAYWFRSQGASLQTVHMIENAAADVVALDEKLDGVMFDYQIEQNRVEELEAELAELKRQKDKEKP